MRLSVGSCLSPYDVLSPLGAGGFGDSTEAVTLLDRTVAIKILPSANPELKERFEREAQAIAPSRTRVCALYNVGHEDQD